MKCSKCGSEIPSQSKFCLSCGQPLSEPYAVSASPAPRKSTAIWAIVAGLVVVAALGAWLIKGKGVTQAPAPAAAPKADVVKTNVRNQPVNLNAPKKAETPQEVIAYLDHLKKVDEARIELQKREVASMLGLMTKAQAANLEQWLKAGDGDVKMDEASSSEEAKKLTSEMNAEWQKLCEFLLSMQAPEPCAKLGGQYYDALRGVLTMFQQINQKVAAMDVGALYVMQGQTSAVDQKFTKSDEELTAVCTRYSIDKTFSISSDGGMPAVTGVPTPPKQPTVP